MSESRATEPIFSATSIPVQTLLVGAESGRRLLLIDGYRPTAPGERIELGPEFDPPGTVGIVTRTSIEEGDGSGPLLVHEVILRRPHEDAGEL